MEAKKVLIVYSSNSGSTKEVAEYILDEISKNEFSVELKSTKEIDDLSQYDSVIIGSSIFYGKWRKDATEFVEKYQQQLQRKKVFYFLTCMALVDGDKEKLEEADNYLSQERKLVTPILEGKFAGEIDLKKLGFIHKMMVKMIKAPVGDFRDWDKIKAWTQEVIEKI